MRRTIKSLSSAVPPWLLLGAIALITRFPYFFKADIDWDEHTFLLLGQSVLDGYLPYTGPVMDIKSPFLWYGFAALSAFAFKQLWIIRLLGTIMVAIAGTLTYSYVKKISDHFQGLFAGITLILLVNLNAGGQAVLSEHLVLIPLVLTFGLLVFEPINPKVSYGAGAVATVAAMVRLNLAYAVLFLGIYLTIITLRDRTLALGHQLLTIISYGLGSLTVVMVAILPYAITHQLDQVYFGLIKAPLSYAQEQASILTVIKKQVQYIFTCHVTSIALAAFSLLIFIAIAIALTTIFSRFKTLTAIEQKYYQVLLIYWSSIEVSIIKSGVFYPHYNLQLIVFIPLLIAPIFSKIFTTKSYPWLKKYGYVAWVITLVHWSLQYQITIKNIYHTGTPNYGESMEIAQILKQENPESLPIWITTKHLAYWLNHVYPVTPILTHPSNLKKEFLIKSWYGDQASTLTELTNIVQAKPHSIIGTEMERYFQDNPPAQLLLDRLLAQHYQLIETNYSYLQFYQLKPEPDPPKL
ncbi:MAG: hypothetical protein HC796_02880 [Synechococcaceae cyanobacterium RL_1_2]|nr:hypothetical protein [Synechococcaceae cyanobacterium RL_1_2]